MPPADPPHVPIPRTAPVHVPRKRTILLAVAAGTLLFGLAAFVLWAFVMPALDRGYQRAMDPVRRRDADAIAALVREYADRTGHLPFEELAGDSPFRVLIGHSTAEEDFFARDPVLPRGHGRARSNSFEKLLSEGLGRPVRLPHDPQQVPTYAPNVYIYLVSGDRFAVASHLFEPHPDAVPYDWRGGTFHSYAVEFGREDGAESDADAPRP